MTTRWSPGTSAAIAAERKRIAESYRHMPLALTPEIYAPWQAAEMLAREERKRVAAMQLQRAHAFPAAHSRCLEVGCGSQGWLGELVTWGVSQRALHGIDLSAESVETARRCLPAADLRIGDATALPWSDAVFHLVIASTVFSSVLDTRVRAALAAEIRRVLRPGGAFVCYDLAVNNPRNRQVRRVTRRELRELFPDLDGTITAVTLAPPLARRIAPHSWTVATLLQALRPLRTHLLAVLIKR